MRRARGVRARRVRVAGLASFVVMACGSIAACSTSAPKGDVGLEIIVAADGLNTPDGFDHIKLEVSEQDDGGWNQLWNNEYLVPSQEASLPTAFTLLAGQSAREVLVSVTAFKGALPIVERVAQVQVPTDRLADLWMVLAKVCAGQVTVTGAEGDPEPKCPTGESCQPTGTLAGQCGPNTISESALPTYTPGDSFDAGMGGAEAPATSSPDAGGSAPHDGGATAPHDAGRADAAEGPSVGAEAGSDATVTAPPDAGRADAADEDSATIATTDSGPESGACTSCCTDACSAGATRCASGAQETCAMQVSGCLGWGAAASCTGGMTCTESACACPSGTLDCGGTCDSPAPANSCGAQCGVACPAPGSNGSAECKGSSCGIVCNSGFSVCGTECVNEQTDSSNCGGCGTTCSGSCAAGRCQVAISSKSASTNQPEFIAVDATSVYWTDDEASTVMKAPIGGGAATTLVSAADSPEFIAVDSSGVYWTTALNSGAVMKVGLGGGATTTLASVSGGAQALAVGPAGVYYLTFSSVMTVGLTGGTPITLASGVSPGYGITVDATGVYWSDSTAVMKVGLSGGTPSALVSGLSTPYAVAVDSKNVYFTTIGDSSVQKAPIGGGSPTVLASGQSQPTRVAVDSTTVYWVTYDNPGALMTIAIGGGTPATLVSGLDYPNDFVIDATSLYWTSPSSGTVTKITPK